MFWICLSLIFALHNSVSSDQGVSLTCNRTVNVTVGENVTLKCFMNSNLVNVKCKVEERDWHDTNDTKLCNRDSKKYICDSDLSDLSLTEEECTVLNHVWCDRNGTKLCSRGSAKYICDSDLSDLSLTVLNVQEEESFTVKIRSNCGMAKSHPIRVRLLHGGTNSKQDHSKSKEESEEEPAPVTTILLCVFAPVVAVVIVCFLCRAYRDRLKRRRYDPSRSEDSV